VAVQPKPVRPLALRRRANPELRTGRRSEAAGASARTSAPPPTSLAGVRSSSGPRGLSRWGGDFLFLVFFVAAVIMVIAVVLVGAVDQWWVLVPVMLVHLAATFGVLVAIVQLLGSDG
jgi:hypothetical protein